MSEAELNIQDLPDSQVDEALDAELRELLAICFRKDQAVFSQHRHFQEPPAHRWIVRDGDGRLIAHACIHDKRLGSGEGELHIGGIAEVCVHPDARGQGWVRRLMAQITPWLRDRHFEFAVLFGKTGVYGSSGYKNIDNPIRRLDHKTGQWIVAPAKNAMILPLSDRPWPDGEIDLRGPLF